MKLFYLPFGYGLLLFGLFFLAQKSENFPKVTVEFFTLFDRLKSKFLNVKHTVK